MKIEGHQTYAANREILWSLLHDPDALARLLPGCESLEAHGPHEFQGTFAVRVGQMVEHFSGSLSLEQSVPLESYEFIARGNNPDGAITCRGRVLLSDEGPDHTTLAYEADIEVSGRPAQLTQRMLQTTARSFARRSFEALQEQVDGPAHAHTTPMVAATAAWGRGAARASSSRALDRLVFRRRLILAALVLLAVLFFRQRAATRRKHLVAEQVAELLDGAGLTSPASDEPSSAALRVSA